MRNLMLILMSIIISASAHGKELLLTSANTVSINTGISSESVDQAIKDLIAADEARKDSNTPIYIVLNSPGGSIIAGNKLINFANTIPNVHTVCMFCASMAHAISQGIKGTRYATEDNIMMAHRAKGGFSGQFEDGEVESQLKLFKSYVRAMELRNAKRIGISLRQYKSKVVNEWWTYGAESVQQNIIDSLVTLACSKELIRKKVPVYQQTMFGLIKSGESSACPLI